MTTPTYTPDSWASNPKYKQPTQQAPLVQQGPRAQQNALMSYANGLVQQGPRAQQNAQMSYYNIPVYTGGGGGGSAVRNNNFMQQAAMQQQQQAAMQQQQQQLPSWAAGMQPGWNFLGNNMQAGSMAQPITWAGNPYTSAVQWAGGQKQGAYKDTPVGYDLPESLDFTGQKRQQRMLEEAKAAAEKNKQEQSQNTTPFEMGTVQMLNGQELPAITGLMNFDIPTPAVESLQQQSYYPYRQYPWWMFGGGGGGGGGGWYSSNPANWTQALVNWRI